ncbi:DUF3987 domain-containing protein [Pseudoflavonifractor sp. 524-17]|nr:DUF3987 domain-containing protein [Pseudoflavonifractor sp. 524-17]
MLCASRMSGSTRAEYRQFVRRILADQGGGVVHLSPEANTIREDYQAYIEKKLGGEWEHMRDWGGKLVGAMVRIAALLHLSSFPANEPISAETIAASGEAGISKRDLFRLVRGKFKKAEGIEAPLRVLAEYSYIRIEDVERDGAGRKASPKIKVNPLTCGHN